ncbi:hypothetical protein ABZ345_00775 [Lentzea sp. NPDC005914]|uniref:hypothetical protein n=1 Tax=Lentzea sp. NPDC005914 TaxID=3154572 RepID=UPI00340AE113
MRPVGGDVAEAHVLRAAVEHHAFRTDPAEDGAGRLEVVLSEALLIAARGF